MKLRNKKTGEIVEKYPDRFVINSGEQIRQYASLTELNEEWEDYEDSKENGFFKCEPALFDNRYAVLIVDKKSNRKEAELAVDKLKAWKRLKDKGFVFKGINENDGSIKTGLSKGVKICDSVEFYEDMTLLFGGEE